MATGKFCSAQDLALSVVGGLDTDVTEEQIAEWDEQDLYDWLEIVGFDFTDQRGWYRYIRDVRNKERHPTVRVAAEQLSLF